MSIRHRLNIIIATLFVALLVAFCVLGLEMRRKVEFASHEAERFSQLSSAWQVAAAAARAPGTPDAARALARRLLAGGAGRDAPALEALLRRLALAMTSEAQLRMMRASLPDIAPPLVGGTGFAGLEPMLGRLLSGQLPEMLWRASILRANAREMMDGTLPQAGERMHFLVDEGRFRAAADTVETALDDAALEAASAALREAADRFVRANGTFREAAEQLAWTVNIAAPIQLSSGLDARSLRRAHAELVDATLALGTQALVHLEAATQNELATLRWTFAGVAAFTIVATLMALVLAISLSSSIVRALGTLERRIRAIADEDANHTPPAGAAEEQAHSELARITRAVIDCRDRVAERVATDADDEKRRDLELIFESNPLPLILHDPETGAIVAVNGTAVEHYGFSRADFLKRRIADLRAQDQRAPAQEKCEGEQSTIRHCKADGEIIEVLPFEREIRYDGQQVRLTTIVDITARRRAESRLAFLAHFDPLTHLANRVLLRQNLAEEVRRVAERGDGGFSLVCLDLDRFKMVNDTLGHEVGDRVLCTVADRLSALVGPNDTVARLGGDGFTLLLAAPDGRARASRLAESVCRILHEPCTIEGARLVLGGSVGVAHYPEHGRSGDELMKHADLALHQAKSDGRGLVCTFAPPMDEALRRRQQLETDLREALDLDRLELYYQPQVDMQSGEVTGFEALVRWNDPARGQVPPSQFIPVAEEVGLIEEIGTWVLGEACRQVAGWPNGVKVAANVSSHQFRSGNLVSHVRKALDDSGLSPERLELEITESVLLEDSSATLQTLHEIRALGVRIAMDDFGTGYSSLSYLRAFPFDKVKIDQSFVGDLGTTVEANAIIRAIAGLSGELGMTTTAEGIETEEQFRQIRAHGCTQAQGFLTGAPVPAAQACIYAAGQVKTLRAVLEHMREAIGEEAPRTVRAVR